MPHQLTASTQACNNSNKSITGDRPNGYDTPEDQPSETQHNDATNGQQATANTLDANWSGQQATAHATPTHPIGQQATIRDNGRQVDTHTALGQQATLIAHHSLGTVPTIAGQLDINNVDSASTHEGQGQQATPPPGTLGGPTKQDAYTPATTSSHMFPEFLRAIQYPHAPDLETHRSVWHPEQDRYNFPHQEIGKHQEAIPYTDQSLKSWPYPSRYLPPELADIYEDVRSKGAPNHSGARRYIKTGLNIQEWVGRTTAHDDDAWIIDSIKYGFPIQYAGPPKYDPAPLYNHSSATNYANVIKEYVKKETSLGALHGPFDGPPFIPWIVVSPLMTRQKPDSRERRVIVDLSYPDGGVNKFIAPHVFNNRPASHNLPTVDDAVRAIAKMCPGDIRLAVIDLSRAYRQFPVSPSDWPLLVIYFEGQYFCDGRIPFGARMSSFAMQSVARFILRAMAAQGITAFMYLDDILIISTSSTTATRDYNATLQLLDALGLQVATHKLQPPSPQAVWLGIHIDLKSGHISIPDGKLREITKCLAAAARQTRITVRHMQSILGYINHLAKVVRPARIFIARLLAALRATTDDYIHVTKHVKADLAWFSRYLSANNARAIIPHGRTVLRIWADSSLQGAGATDGRRYYSHTYTKKVASTHHITQLEAMNVLAAVRAFVDRSHAAGVVEVYCDNSASMASYTSGRARDCVLAACCRAMWFKAAATETTLEFAHAPGEGMVLPDALSRAKFDPALNRKARKIVHDRDMCEVSVDHDHFTYADFN